MKVKCGNCKNEQVIFERPAGNIKCLVCGDVLAKSTGGKAKISEKTKVLEVVRQ